MLAFEISPFSKHSTSCHYLFGPHLETLDVALLASISYPDASIKNKLEAIENFLFLLIKLGNFILIDHIFVCC